jgi:hypothetical protein
MPDFPDSTQSGDRENPETREVRDPESNRPFREVFARRLPAELRRELETSARTAYSAALEAGTRDPVEPSAGDTRQCLRAAVVDLRETAELLGAVGREHQESVMDWSSTMLSILAAPRRLELEAVIERLEETLAWESTTARLFPPKLVEAALVPSSYQPEPIK